MRDRNPAGDPAAQPALIVAHERRDPADDDAFAGNLLLELVEREGREANVVG